MMTSCLWSDFRITDSLLVESSWYFYGFLDLASTIWQTYRWMSGDTWDAITSLLRHCIGFVSQLEIERLKSIKWDGNIQTGLIWTWLFSKECSYRSDDHISFLKYETPIVIFAQQCAPIKNGHGSHMWPHCWSVQPMIFKSFGYTVYNHTNALPIKHSGYFLYIITK